MATQHHPQKDVDTIASGVGGRRHGRRKMSMQQPKNMRKTTYEDKDEYATPS